MTLKEIFITGGWSDKYRRHTRPVWQIVLLLIPAALSVPARAYVRWMDSL